MPGKEFDIDRIRNDFPLLRNSDIAYLDNAATSQKPECVLQKEREFYDKYNANPFRGLYELSEKATEVYEDARKTVQKFIHANEPEEIVFTRNATESLNLVAYSLSQVLLEPGDEILISIAEHHSNMLPWRQAAQRAGAQVKYIDCDKNGKITKERISEAINEKTKLLAVAQISNVFGNANEIKEITEICHEHGIVVVVDGAQSVPHIPEDVCDLDVDFLAFSGHKMLAPMGIGVLYGKRKWLEIMPPFLTGGEMIESVSSTDIRYAQIPHKFEAGTVNAGGAAALAEAIRYMEGIGFEEIQKREDFLTEIAMEQLQKIPGVRIVGAEEAKVHHGILTFTVEGVHPHDVAAILDADRIAVRAGHHCAQPLHQYLGIMSTTRASFMFYNTEEEILRFAESVRQIRRKMGYGE